MLRPSAFKGVFLLVLSVLLVTTSAFGQDKSLEATKATRSEAIEQESTVETAATTGEVGSSVSTKKTGVHFELHPELAGTAKRKRSLELFQTSKLNPNFSRTTNETDVQQPAAAGGADSAAELSKKLSNPVASLISFPIQTNFDFGMGNGGSGWRMTMNIQPVIPIALNAKWNLISRTIIPIIHQANVVAPGTGQSGLGDIAQSFFLSPNKSEPFIWGVGPVVLLPTATNEFLGGKQLGLGPTVVVLKQQGQLTFGALWNHVWRVAGGSGRPKVNSDFIQPFISYSTKDAWTYGLNTESTYDWTGNSWSVPVHFNVAKIVRFGKQPISFGGQLRCWVTSPTGGPESCGLRAVVTGIFPKK
jgi:hypothetical protein